ncbi:hydroquinone glucosyltransferase-like [Camellia sinensis]|uniref:UDP-glycosyltransferases domain-containing protein n=1 Tax=Camellia sinensis var. sinensis TaxID=542762 RepID=A0A4S4DNW9_CAMSN|nr:hydroquinone glucosyltransferase-like [Camellia sinensis]THG04732.1 hypothetical protein TEA_013623 [Camellia sinensis var. sinensis]
MTRVPALRDSLKVLTESNHLVALVVDVVGTDAFDVAKVFCLLRYIFIPLCAKPLSLFLHLSKLDETGISNYRDLPEPVKIPGCVPIKGTELLETFQNRNSESYKLALYHTKRYNVADGVIIISFIDLESKTFKVLMKTGSGKSPVYPIGPLLQTGPISGGGSGYECLRWLDEQPRGSVLFVSFGSSGTLTHEQLTELALGLEMSEQRFIWVVRSPAKNAANAVYYNAQSSKEDDPNNFLPKGFLERTRGVGLLVRSWAPQIQIMSHSSTGGFLTHWRWNSILESIHGVPLIAWPLFTEQEMHTVMLTQEFEVAFRPKKNENGIVCHEEITKHVRYLIVGEEGKLVRHRAKELKDAAAMATSQH